MKNEFPEHPESSAEDLLRLENDLLRLKLQAELGAHFGGSHPDLPPAIEKQFLEQVLEFHRNLEKYPPLRLREYLDNPDFRPSSELTPSELEKAWERINELYHEKQLRVDFLAEYPLAQRYDFMAVELMEEEIDRPTIEGQYLCFIYEEAHPNHDYDQRSRTQEFMDGFFKGQFHEWFLAHELITDHQTSVTLEQAQALLDRFHGMFTAIKDWSYEIRNTSAQTDDEIAGDMPRLGFTEGLVRYVALHADGSEQEITGPFKLYMQCSYGWWQVMHFYMHGFSWR